MWNLMFIYWSEISHHVVLFQEPNHKECARAVIIILSSRANKPHAILLGNMEVFHVITLFRTGSS